MSSLPDLSHIMASSSAEVTPRVSTPHLGEFQGRNVRILGRVTSLRGEEAQIDASGICSVHLTRDAHLAQGTWVEVLGRVNPDLTVKAMLCTDWGTDVGECPGLG